MLLKIMCLFVRLAIVVNVLLVEGSPLFHGRNNFEDALQFNNLFDCEENNQGPSDEDTSALVEEILRKSEKLLTTNNRLINLARPADSHGNKIIIKYIYGGPVFFYNNDERNVRNPWKLMAKDNNAISMLKSENYQNYKAVEIPIVRSFFDYFNFKKLLHKIGLKEKVVLKQKDKDISKNDFVEKRGIIRKKILELIEEILTKSDKLSTTKYSKKFVEAIRNKIGTEMEKTVNYIQEKYQMTDLENPKVDKVWIQEVISYLIELNTYLDHLFEKDKNISEDVILSNRRNALLDSKGYYISQVILETRGSIINELLALEHEKLTKDKKHGIAYGDWNKERLKNDLINRIVESVKYYRKRYFKNHEDNPELDETLIEEIMNDLLNEKVRLNTSLKYINFEEKYGLNDTIHETMFHALMFEREKEMNNYLIKYKPYRKIARLIEEILRESEVLLTANNSMKSVDKIRNEVETKIENSINYIQKNYQLTDEPNPESDEIWIKQAMTYLIEMKQVLDYLVTKIKTDISKDIIDTNRGIILDEIKSTKVISILVEDILRKSDKLSTAKYPMKPNGEIKDEVELKIANILLHSENNFKFREKDNPELDEIWIIKAIAYLIDMNNDLNVLMIKNGLEDETIKKYRT